MKTFNQLLKDYVSPRVFHLEDFKESDLAFLKDLYDKQPIFVERLPYTEMFDAIVQELNIWTSSTWEPHVVYNLLTVLRKNGRLLPKK